VQQLDSGVSSRASSPPSPSAPIPSSPTWTPPGTPKQHPPPTSAPPQPQQQRELPALTVEQLDLGDFSTARLPPPTILRILGRAPVQSPASLTPHHPPPPPPPPPPPRRRRRRRRVVSWKALNAGGEELECLLVTCFLSRACFLYSAKQCIDHTRCTGVPTSVTRGKPSQDGGVGGRVRG